MKLENDYAIIETAEEAGIYVVKMDIDYAASHHSKREVLEAITPKEGNAVFFWYEPPSATWDRADINKVYYMNIMDHGYFYAVYVKANALTIGKTVGELRALLEWAKGDE